MEGNNQVAGVCGVSVRDMRSLEEEISNLNRKSDRIIKGLPVDSDAEETPTGLRGYVLRNLRSGIVRYGTIALLAFAAGGIWHERVADGYRSAKQAADKAISYVAVKMFNALPEEKKYEVIRENSQKMAPQAPANKADKQYDMKK